MDPLLSASKLAASALTAQSTRVRIVSQNLANSDTTGRTPGADPYIRKLVTFSETLKSSFAPNIGIKAITNDESPFRLEFKPGHPAADPSGFVKFPNVNPLIEMADFKDANRAYQANLQTIRQIRNIYSMTIDMLKG